MTIYLDSCIIIYWIEGPVLFGLRVRSHISSLQAAGHRFAVSEIARLECLVKPFSKADGGLLLDFETLFLDPDIVFVPLTAPVFERAANIRGIHRYVSGKRSSMPDSLHLAVAVQNSCGSFLTNDSRLAGFQDIPVEILP